MEGVLQSEAIVVAITFAIYFLAQRLQKKTGIMLLNPVLITIVIIIALLMLCNIDYETYRNGSKYIDFFLKPAIVALGVPGAAS